MMRRCIGPWRIRNLMVSGLVGVVALVGCSSAGPETGESSGESSVFVSPAVSSDLSSSSIASSDSSLSQDELEAEAERVYRSYFELEQDVVAAGGADELPSEMNEYIMSPYSDAAEVIYRNIKEHQWKTRPGTRATLMNIVPIDVHREESLVAMELCFDTRDASLVDSQDTIVGADINHDVIYLKYDNDGLLKIFSGASENVDRCPIG